MHYMTSYIQIGDKGFTHINSVKIVSSRKSITDTAVIKLANVKTLLNDEKKKIKVGEIVTIALGYQDNNTVVFNGYVTAIKPTSPIEIICEDEMWQLKQQTITKSWETVKLVDVLKYIVNDINTVECPDVTLSSFRLVNVTKAKALETIKETYGLDIYFRDKKLFAGLAYTESGMKTIKYHFQKNVPSKILQTGLIYKKKEDVKIKVHAVSMLPNNKQIQVTVGDDDGETRTMHYYNLTEKELTHQAITEMDSLKFNGYRGSLVAFGIPIVKHGYKAKLINDETPTENGSFFIDTVEIDYNFNGYRNLIYPGKRAS